MKQRSKFNKIFPLIVLSICILLGQNLFGAKPLILQEMTWTDVKEYLKNNDMVIIPIGSTEQHGPHLPLGTDFYEAMGCSKLISAKTGVVVAPVLLSGYSIYHSGFPGTLSLKPETMENVLYETAEMLIHSGFSRFMFFNYHGGNRVVEAKVINRINQNTTALAVAIGIGSPVQKKRYQIQGVKDDNHAGVNETSAMLYLKPQLVRMERAEKPVMKFSAKVKRIIELSKINPDLLMVISALQAVPAETGKGGASHEISSNGIWSSSDPKISTKEFGLKIISLMVNNAVKFINVWKLAK